MTLHRSLGLVLAVLLHLLGCEGGAGDSDSSGDTAGGPDPRLENTAAFVEDGPYRSVLASCIAVTSRRDSCRLEDLPLLGMEVDAPDIPIVMEHVAVSHDWMGQRFEQVLAVLPEEILQLMGGVTAVVIDDDIRPSSYHSWTGAIYLDPANLWLTNEERATIGTEPDYRRGFGVGLAFRSLSRHVLGDEYAYPFYPLSGSQERTLDEIRYRVASLLLHELAHANDYFPPATIADLDWKLTVATAADQGRDGRVSERLAIEDPLTSEQLFGLARVRFRGIEATRLQEAITAAEVADSFALDFASHDYSYTTVREDVAMLFEEAMMKYLFDIDRDIAFTPTPTSPASCSDYVVAWGTRNRIGDVEVIERARFVVSELMPETDFSSFFESLPLPTFMQSGLDWCSNLQLGADARARRSSSSDRIARWNERVAADVGEPHE